jgi:hypothetical protein
MESRNGLSDLIEEIDKLLCVLKADTHKTWYSRFQKTGDRAKHLNISGFSHKEIAEPARMVTDTYNVEPNFNTYVAAKGTIGLESTRRSVFECTTDLVAKRLKDLGLLEVMR